MTTQVDYSLGDVSIPAPTACESCGAALLDGSCTVCGIYHDEGNACRDCGRAGWHRDDCPTLGADALAVEVEIGEDTCDSCGGSADNVVGCMLCCSDCGFPCSQEKDGEGFHDTSGDEEA